MSLSVEPSTETGNDRRGRSKRGLTCANCRVRKTRCDGSLPGCKTCEVYKVECHYERPPPMSQILSMAQRLQESERIVADLRSALARASTSSRPPAFSQAGGDISATEDSPFDDATGSTVLDHGTMPTNLEGNAGPESRLLSDLSLDERGKLCYYGPTSAVHAPLPESPNNNVDDRSSFMAARSVLSSSALESRSWEEFAIGNAAMQTGIPHHVISRLLSIHWTWVNPTFNWVYRPAFMRDMAIGGPYYSPFLLTVMSSHAARFDSSKTSETLISKARLLLGAEIHRPSCIPTVQALLQLSARDLAMGSTSQAWLYSGMAFRMVSDLGLYHSAASHANLNQLNAEDLEIRRRLFWSCYFWDKAISIYFGRMPVLLELPYNAPELIDDSAEIEPWSPHHGDSINLSKVSVAEYPPAKSHAISSFENVCKLSIIMNDIILCLYSRRQTTDMDKKLRVIRESLDNWRSESPAQLKCDPDNLPQTCPVPHILSQNLLYYTTIILLHRPFNSNPAHHAACRAASDSIEKLVLLLEKTFGVTRVTYLMAYCVYTAASVLMQDVKMGDMNANAKMQTLLRCLEGGTRSCPLIQRSIDIITTNLGSHVSDHVRQVPAEAPTQASAPLVANYLLPAFPYQAGDTSLGADLGDGSMNIDGVSYLDAFPEAQYSNLATNATWFYPNM